MSSIWRSGVTPESPEELHPKRLISPTLLLTQKVWGISKASLISYFNRVKVKNNNSNFFKILSCRPFPLACFFLFAYFLISQRVMFLKCWDSLNKCYSDKQHLKV